MVIDSNPAEWSQLSRCAKTSCIASLLVCGVFTESKISQSCWFGHAARGPGSSCKAAAEVLCKLAFMGKMRSLPQLWAECLSPPQFGPRPTCLPLALSTQSPDCDGKSTWIIYLSKMRDVITEISHYIKTFLKGHHVKFTLSLRLLFVVEQWFQNWKASEEL